MHVLFSKRFKKRHSRLDLDMQNKFRKRLELYLSERDTAILNVHQLKGEFTGYYSLNVTGDIRLIFRHLTDSDVIFLFDIGSHSELYE